MQEGMTLVNEKWKGRAIPTVSMRIGIYQGLAVVGNFGSPQRVDYTAICPTVSLASRIESECLSGAILVSSVMREESGADAVDFAGAFDLKGIEGEIALYRLRAS